MTVELEPQIGSLKDEPAGADEMEVVEPDSEPNSEPNSEPDSDSESAPDPQSSMPTPPKRSALVIHSSRMHWKNLEDRNDTEQKPECRLEATGLVKTMDNLETGIMAAIWDEILQRFNSVSLMLQHSQLDLNSAISLFDSVIEFTALQRSIFLFFRTKGERANWQ